MRLSKESCEKKERPFGLFGGLLNTKGSNRDKASRSPGGIWRTGASPADT